MSGSGLWPELWSSKAWRLYPGVVLFVVAITLVVPHMPTLLTNDFASRRAGHALRCETYVSAVAPAACRDAHSEVVAWASGASFLSNTVISLFMVPLVGHWSDVHGRRPFLVAPQLASLGALSMVLLHLHTGLPLTWFYVVQVCLSGFSSVAVYLAFLADLLPPASRTAAFGLFLGAAAAGVIVGPSVGSVLTVQTAVQASLLTLRRVGGPACAEKSPAWRAVAILTRSRLFVTLTICMMLTGMTSEGLQDLVVQYLQLKLDFGVASQAQLFVVLGVGGMVVQGVLLRPLMSIAGDKSMLTLGLAASLVYQIALALAVTKTQALAAVGLGTLGSVTFPIISSLKSNHAAQEEQGAVQGALLGARAVAAGVGPLVFSLIFSMFTRSTSPLPYFPGAPFYFGALLTLGAGAAALSMPIPWTAGRRAGSRLVAGQDDGPDFGDAEAAEHALLPTEARPLL